MVSWIRVTHLTFGLVLTLSWHTFVILGERTVIQVEIACPGVILPISNGALPFVGPALDLAVQAANQRYAGIFNFTLTYIISKNPPCPTLDGDSPDMIPEWYFRRHNPQSIAAILGLGCFTITSVHQLTGSENMLFFLISGNEESKFTLGSPPPVGASYVSVSNIARVTLELLKNNSWTNSYMVVDFDSPPVYFRVGNEVTLQVTKYPSVRVTRRNIHTNSTDDKTSSSFVNLLEEFRTSSRVMVFFGRANILRRLLIDAANLNLTNGEFVYICIEPFYFDYRYGKLSWQYDNINDTVAKRAFKYLLLIHPATNPALDSYSPSDIEYGKRFIVRAKEMYNFSYTPKEQNLPDLLTCYSTISVFAQILNETLVSDGQESLYDGRRLYAKLLNRTFLDGVANLYFTPNGQRYMVLEVVQFTGPKLHNRQAFLVQSKLDPNSLESISNASVIWDDAPWPPPNRPFCGYTNQNPQCFVTTKLSSWTIVVPTVLVYCLCCLVAAWRSLIWSRLTVEGDYMLAMENLHFPSMCSRAGSACRMSDSFWQKERK